MTNQIKIKYEKEDCILNGIVCKEPIDVIKLDKLINSSLLKSNFNNEFFNKEHKTEYDQLIKYKKLVSDGCAIIKYNKVKCGVGRSNPERALGLFSIRRALRHTLTKNKMVDIDIINCHPVILMQICKQNNIECPNLENYINNRSEYIEKVMTTYNVDKNDAKKLFIQLIYFGSFESWANNKTTKSELIEIINFKKELNFIGTKIIANLKPLLKIITKHKESNGINEFNEIGSTISYFLQEIECKILETIFKYCITNKVIEDNRCVLCADGLMIETYKYNSSLLTEFNEIIKSKFNLDLTFVVKEMDEDLSDILDANQYDTKTLEKNIMGYDNSIIESNEDFNVNTLNEYFEEDKKYIDNFETRFYLTKSFKYFNTYHAQFYNSNKLYKIYEKNITCLTNYIDSFNHLYIEDKNKKIKFTEMYDINPKKRIYSTFDFEPNMKIKNDKYNLFNGFKYDDIIINNIENDIIKIFTDHIKYLCGSDASSEYVLNWMSHIVQFPEKKTNVAVVLYSSTEGVGKNLLIDIFDKLLDGYTTKFRDTSALTDKFNADMMGKLLVVGDEINARCTEVANELKDIITRNKENIEFKGKDKFICNDYKNYIFTTNNENVFKVSNTDRRFMFIECPEVKQSKQYYENLIDFRSSDNCLRHLYHYLKRRNISNFATSDIEMTEFKERLIMHNIPAYIKFVVEEYDVLASSEIETKDLYKMSIEYAKKNRMPYSYTEFTFYKQFKKVFGQYNLISAKTKKSIYKFPICDKDNINDIIMKNYIIKQE